MNIYCASSWRNPHQQEVVELLRKVGGHEVYDFRNPAPGNTGFAWSAIEPEWLEWDASKFITALKHPVAAHGFACDWNAMVAADACVLVLPCGRSAHIEAGYFVGARKKLVILMLGKNEPELMYKMADAICVNVAEVITALNRLEGAAL